MTAQPAATLVDTKHHMIHRFANVRPRHGRVDGLEATCGWFAAPPWQRVVIIHRPYDKSVLAPPTLRDGKECEPCWKCAGADIEPTVGREFDHPTWAGTRALITAVEHGGVYFRYSDPTGDDRTWFMVLEEWQALIASTEAASKS